MRAGINLASKWVMEGLATLTDDRLVRKAADGDRAAFEELVRRFTRLVYAKVYLETGDAHRSEDLVQETFVTAYRSIRQLQDGSGFRPWLLSIARNACIDALRREKRRKRSGFRAALDPDALAAPSDAPEESAERRESREQVMAVIRSLPEGYREPILLRYLLGCDYHTIARQLGLGEGQLRGMLNRGMRMLRDEMKRVSKRGS